ncbi:hypothetical protein Hanom_Chr09g00770391 [Helianthus anomalus]
MGFGKTNDNDGHFWRVCLLYPNFVWVYRGQNLTMFYIKSYLLLCVNNLELCYVKRC